MNTYLKIKHHTMSDIILIADSGSTKTDWLLCNDGMLSVGFKTQGINPYMLSENEIANILQEELLCKSAFVQPQKVRFYGAGCRGEQCSMLKSVLRKLMPQATDVVVDSDLVGAAKALCGDADGIACIMGTGSNSCLYVGGKIVQNVSPLGYILGDEGSGAVLGKRLISDLLKSQLPEDIKKAFFNYYHLNLGDIIRRVYKEPFANRFLASFAPFLHQHKEHEAIRALLLDEFGRFFKRNIERYQRNDLNVSFVGSVAYYFQNELKIVAQNYGYNIGKILKSPLDGMKGVK